MYDNNKISILVEQQAPSFAREDYDVLISFLKAYYEWLEEPDNFLNFLQNYQRNIDIDSADESFVLMFLQEFADFLPKDKKLDDVSLIKYIKEFYLSKGSEDSFKFIFRVLYNAGIDILHPRDWIFKSSDGVWTGDIIIRTTNTNVHLLRVKPESNIVIVGVHSGATAVVDTMQIITNPDGTGYAEFELSSYTFPFAVDEAVRISVDNHVVIEQILNGVVGFEIMDGGTGFNEKDKVEVVGPSGERFSADVKSVTEGGYIDYQINASGTGYEVGELVYVVPSNNTIGGNGFIGNVYRVGASGEIEAIEIINSGYGYSGPTQARIDTKNGNGADITLTNPDIGSISSIRIYDYGVFFNKNDVYQVIVDGISINTIKPQIGTVFEKVKRFANENGFTSHNMRLQDSFYYQIFSYAIKTNIVPQKWYELTKKLAHPAGSELFSIWTNISESDMSNLSVVSSIVIVLHIITEAVNYVLDSIIALDIDKEYKSISTCVIGNNLNNLEEVKFNDTFNWTVEPFLDLSVADIEKQNCSPSMNQTEDAYINLITI